MRKNVLRISAFVVSAVLLVSSLTACGSSESGATSTTGTDSPTSALSETPGNQLKEVTLKFFFPGDDKAGKNDVLNYLYEQTKDKLNSKFEFNFVPFGDYSNKMTMLSASGDTYDASFTADWFNYSSMVNKGAYLELNDLMPQYAPNLYKIYQDNNMISACSVGGQLMALPWTMVKTSKPVFCWRDDIAKKYNITANKDDLTTIEGIDKFLTELAKAETGITPFSMSINGAGLQGGIISLLEPKYEMDPMGFHSLYMDLNDPSHKVIPLEQTPMFKEAVTLAKKWYDSGVISKNAMSSKDNREYENGKALTGKNTAQYLYETVNFTDKSAVNSAVEVYPGKKYRRDSPLNNALAINKNAANPERALMFIDLLSSDQNIYDIVQYGIKDKTYTMDANNVVGITANEDSSKPLWQNWTGQWALWRINFQRATTSITADAIKNEQAYATRDNIIVTPVTGLVPNTDAIKTEIAKRDQIFEESGKMLLAGIVKGDIDKAINDYIAKQKAAGLDKILADVQKQVDSYISAKK